RHDRTGHRPHPTLRTLTVDAGPRPRVRPALPGGELERLLRAGRRRDRLLVRRRRPGRFLGGPPGPGGVAARRGRPDSRPRRPGGRGRAARARTDGAAHRPPAARGGAATKRPVRQRRLLHPGQVRRPDRPGAGGKRPLRATGGARRGPREDRGHRFLHCGASPGGDRTSRRRRSPRPAGGGPGQAGGVGMTTVTAAPLVEYTTIAQARGPLLVVQGVRGVGWDEFAYIKLPGGQRRHSLVLEVDRDLAVVQVLEGTDGIDPERAAVSFEGTPLRIPVGPDWLGRVCNGRGEPLDGGPPVFGTQTAPVAGLPLNPTRREPPQQAVITGVSAVDGLTTLVRGQKLPIFSVAGLPHLDLATQIAAQASVGDEPFSVVFAAMGLT